MPTSDRKRESLSSLQKEVARLKRAVEELSTLNDLARSIGASLDSQQVMRTIVNRSLRAVNGEQGVITLVGSGEASDTTTLIRTQLGSSEHTKFHLDRALLGWMFLNRKPLLVDDPRRDERFRGVKFDESISSFICVPMMVKSELRGVLTVYNKKEGRGFSEDDERLLAIIAAQSAQVVENARLYEEEKQLLKIREELRLASRIQTDLLPKTCPQIPGYDIAAGTIPADQVGGDYFDFIRLDQNLIGLCVGDVSGKGLPASLLMANLQATLRGQALLTPPPKECLSRANRLLFRSTGEEKFATLFYAVLDTARHSLCYSNAGHDRPVLLRQGRPPQRPTAGGIPLGMVEEWIYEDESIELQSGDLLVVFSDGVREAVDSRGEHFGDDRAIDVVTANVHLPAQKLMEVIIGAVRSYASGSRLTDDMTLIVLKKL
ncbi:MAG: PP2C family protein-serine/threonine phosphatase [Ignavibacteria bacterium]|nr:PP2C family protein-serine/threonine phosphatase [Ignavibacteria bacterium]